MSETAGSETPGSDAPVKALLYGLFLYRKQRFCDTGFRSRDQVFLQKLGEILPDYLPVKGTFRVLAVGEIWGDEGKGEAHGNSTNAAGTDITPDGWTESDDVRAGRPVDAAREIGA